LSGHVAPEALERPHFLTAPPKLGTMGALLAGALEGSALLLEGLMLATLAELFAPQPARAPLSEPQLAAVQARVLAALHRQVSLAELAEAAGLSESRFSHAFKQSTGETPHRWQMRLRVEAASARMLAAPGLGLAEIAVDCGFADQAHLGRVFRAHFGRTPADWRRHAAGSSQSQQDHSIHALLS
ncbi:MAG: helix-turn-helix transcriptional regulator, partial [Gemmobacter sp.]|uniref:helix-turn-helix domain-containing protein n=1 Tax=Gemmobacter sp. TaxID=1898957 RepID=UPI001A62CD8A